MRRTKKLKNLKVFAPKRKYNSPKDFDLAVRPNCSVFTGNDLFTVQVTNLSDKPLYMRYE